MNFQNSIRRSFRKGRTGRNEHGSVVILTLWAVAFLALLEVAVAGNVATHLNVASDLKWGTRSHTIGMRALADAVTVLQNDKTDSVDALADAWANNDKLFRDVPYSPGVSYSITSSQSGYSADDIQRRYGLGDEDGKISLNRAPYQVLSSLFQTAEMTSVQADDLAHFIVDWRDADISADGKTAGVAEACAGLSVPYGCKNADFEALEELWWMPGMTAALYDAVRGELTLYGGYAVNANTAGVLAFRSFGLTAGGAEKVVRWLSDPGNVFESTSAIMGRAVEIQISEEDQTKLRTAASSGLLGTRSSVFRAEVEADYNGRPRRVASFIVDRNGKLKWWRE